MSFAVHADNPNAPWLESFAQDVQEDARKHNIPGYVFVFVERGKPAQVISFGKTARNERAIDENTVFRLASVSKTFTAALVAKLVENRQLHWQTSLSSLAPEFGFTQQGLDGLTLQHLLGQSSGFTPNAYDNLIEANYSLKRILNKLADLEPLCSPGRCYTYQNALFGVLEHYFNAQDSSYRQQLSRYIIQPLAMPSASAGKAALLSSSNWAKPHIAITRDTWKQGTVRSDYYRVSPAAGVNASIRDMEIWVRAMLGEYPHVISADTIKTLTTPTIKTRREMRRRDWREYLNDAHYGLGWRVYDFNGNTLNYHGGWVKGYRADVAFAPEQGVGYAMLMNAESNRINSFTAEFWQQYFQHLEQARNMAASTPLDQADGTGTRLEN